MKGKLVKNMFSKEAIKKNVDNRSLHTTICDHFPHFGIYRLPKWNPAIFIAIHYS